MFRRMRKLIAGLLVGSGIGILLILFIPAQAWLVLIGIGLIICRNKLSF